MKKLYESPEAKLICFQSLDRIALLEHEVSPASDDGNGAFNPSMGVTDDKS